MVRYSKLIAAAALVLTTCSGAVPVNATTVCAKRDAIVKVLLEKHQELVSGLGILDSGTGMVELYIGPLPKRTFSIVITDRNELSCITLTGENWTDGGMLPKGVKNARY